MQLKELTLQFESPEEQEFYEEEGNLTIWERETWPANDEDGNVSWTTFDVEGWNTEEIKEELFRLAVEWESRR